MNLDGINRRFIQEFERTASFDFYVFYPKFLSRYDYRRDVDGHVVDIDTDAESLTHSDIRQFVRSVMANDSSYEGLYDAYTNYLPSGKAFDFEDKKVAVRHLRGHWTTSSSTRDMNIYFNNPLFGTTSTDLAHNLYLCWVGGYQRNRVYYGDLIVPVARKRFGPAIRNESILPVHIVRGVLTPDRLNGTGLLVEDWLEYRTEYRDDAWSNVKDPAGEYNTDNKYVLSDETDVREFRILYTENGETVTVYFDELGGDLISKTVIPKGVTITVQQLDSCTEADVSNNVY